LNLFASTKPKIIAYDGFEPSGRMHIAQGLMKAINVNKLTSCGVHFVFWVADWFALLNNKMGGDLSKIQTVGKYMIEVWKAAGMNMDKVEFLWSSEEILKRADEYWSIVFDIATKNSLTRVMRCTQIMGRSENDDLSAAQIFYPVMQCADIFFLKADICQLGMDQRKVNMLAREYCTDTKKKFKPIVLSHHMMMGLVEGQEKMSKSMPDSAIFMEDSEADVNAKIKKAFCPIGVVEKNPVMDYFKHIVFESDLVKLNPEGLLIERTPENGGNVNYKDYATFEADYVKELLHPKDVKAVLAKTLNKLIQPVRDHFENNPEAKAILQKVRSFSVTR
jgi:tyrosyl-tRNA synthetase